MAEYTKKVLLVDDEPLVLEALNEYLMESDRGKYAVLKANNGRQAMEILDSEDICIVISDIYMSEISGIQLLVFIKENYPDTNVILMTAFYSEQVRTKAEENGCLNFIEKPFEFEQIRKLILENIAKRKDGFVGTLRNIQLTDLIQMCCLSPTTMAIRVAKGALEGIIYMQEGEIVHASCDAIQGEEAFYTILGWETGSFETLGSIVIPNISINKSWQSLLMEAVRRIDEKNVQLHLPEINGQGHTGETETDNDTDINLDQNEQIGVLIVEDSGMMFNALEKMLTADKNIKVLGRAKNGSEVLTKINELNPDLITLDVNMPVMDGGTALKHIMIKNPCPVIIISSMGSGSQTNVLDFLRLGAIDFIVKPSKGRNMDEYQKYLIETIKLGSKAKTENFKRVKNHKLILKKMQFDGEEFSCERLVIIKAGPGGYAEVMRIIPELPRMLNCSILVFLTAAPELIFPFSDYLDKRSLSPVFSLNNGTWDSKKHQVNGGACYIGSDGISILMVKNNSTYHLDLNKDIKAEPLPKGYYFNQYLLSTTKNFSGRIQVVLLSGSEMECLEGIRKIKEKGGRIIMQTPEFSMVPFSLQRIIHEGIVDVNADPLKIAEHILLDVR
jgi:two-component system, chemotaxis family, protein-glutamate methylesterase/glutaminase